MAMSPAFGLHMCKVLGVLINSSFTFDSVKVNLVSGLSMRITSVGKTEKIDFVDMIFWPLICQVYGLDHLRFETI